MSVEINNQQKIRVKISEIKRQLEYVLSLVHLQGSEVSILLTSDAAIHDMNKAHRGQDQPTDILSFGMREHRRSSDPLPPHPEVLGDLVVSVQTVQRQAMERGVSFREELLLVLIHGVLHLIGYDHTKPLDRERMFALQAQLLLACQEKWRFGGHRDSA